MKLLCKQTEVPETRVQDCLQVEFENLVEVVAVDVGVDSEQSPHDRNDYLVDESVGEQPVLSAGEY